jgi:circadian clock protein KaiB
VPRKREQKARADVTALTATTVVEMRLYIADSATNSAQAVANLEAICQEYLQDRFTLEIINVLEFPERALEAGILVTPSLTNLKPAPSARIVGNLSDRPRVLYALGIKP